MYYAHINIDCVRSKMYETFSILRLYLFEINCQFFTVIPQLGCGWEAVCSSEVERKEEILEILLLKIVTVYL